MRYSILGLFLILFVIVGCSQPNKSPTTSKRSVVVNGSKYIFVKGATTNKNGVVDVELWEKEGITNKYYTPSLDGNFMNPILR